jgi:hypothetical protein
MLKLDGDDLRRLPIEIRKAGLPGLLRKRSQGIALIEDFRGHRSVREWRNR